MAYDDRHIIIGKDHSGNALYGGWRFQMRHIPQGTTLQKAELLYWYEQVYPTGLSVYDDFRDTNGVALDAHSMIFGPATDWDEVRGDLEIQSNQVKGEGDKEWLYKLYFDSGSVEFTVGEVVTGASSGRAGIVVTYSVTGGTWGGGNASGYLILSSAVGPYTNNEALDGSVGGNNMATANGGGSGYWQPLRIYHIYSFASGVSDGILRCRSMAVDAGSDLCDSGLLFRYQDYDHYIRFSVNGDGNAVIGAWNEDTWDTPYNTASGFPADTWYDLEVVFDGESIICKIDGVEVFNETSARYLTEEAHGVWGNGYGIDTVADAYCLWMEAFDFMPITTPSPNLEVACDDVDNSANFDTGGLPGTRVLTTARDAMGDISGWDKGTHGIIDITTSVQEIIDRGGWAPDNYLSVLMGPEVGCGNGERVRMKSYETDRRAKLGLEWRP